MTGRSFDSIASERRRQHRVTDEDVYNYTLRVAYLTWLLTPKPPSEQSVATPTESREHRESREYSSRLSAISNSIYSFGDIIREAAGRDASKQVKFPEKLLEILDQKLRSIAMGKDPHYTDQQTRRIIAVFWSSFSEPNFYKQLKRNRKIEELILNFVTTASTTLRKDPQLGSGDGWKIELNNQIAHFVAILRDSVRLTSHVPPELVSRLDMYASKLIPAKAPPVPTSSWTPAEQQTPQQRGPELTDMPFVKIVGKLYDKTDDDLLRDLNNLRPICTERAALTDFKTCLNNIHAGLPFPGRREDFDDDLSFQQWKSTEQSHLSQLVLIMVQSKPELARSGLGDSSAPRPDSLYHYNAPLSPTTTRNGSNSDRNSVAFLQTDSGTDAMPSDEEFTGRQFTYIPPNPRKAYKKLIEKCVNHDLQAMHTLPEDQEVSLGILSPRHLDIINECALRWRIMQSYRVTCFLDVIKYKYEREEVPLECIPEALTLVEKAIGEHGIEGWTRQDREYLATVYSSIFNIFLSALYHALDELPGLSRKSISPFLSILERVQSSGLLEQYQVDVDSRVRELSERVRILAVHHYSEISTDLFSQEEGHAALPFLLLTDALESLAKKLDKTWGDPLLGHLDIVGLFVETEVPMYITDLEGSKQKLLQAASRQPEPDLPIEDVFKLYRRTKVLLDILKAFAPQSNLEFDLANFFEVYVREWLKITDNRTGLWVQSAISVDKFVAEGTEKHSSSIIDLFDSLNTPVEFLLNLEWPDQSQDASFVTQLSKTISKCLEQYCRRIEDLFMDEMFPRPAEPHLQPQKQSAWLEKAKQTMQSEKKIIPFNFTQQSCVKLNNIEAARNLLDKLYKRLDADNVSSILQEKPLPQLPTKSRNLFTVKIVMAENLISPDGKPLDTFVTLSDEHGNRAAKTRTIYESLNPRWEETYDISVEETLWLMASIRDRQLVGKHDTVGRSYICLDPRRFGDFLTHDVWLDLDTQGRLLLRVSMEGERDDILFYFGRAFRSLKRAEGDMVRIFIDKMTPFFQEVLSRSNLKRLVKTGTGIDYGKALGNFNALLGSLGSNNQSEVQIPLPQQEKPRIKPDSLQDEEIEAALGPLYDYLNENLQTLNSSLSETARETVMTRIWKELVSILEGLLVPPLSEAPSNQKPLSDKEIDVVFKWLKSLLSFFHAEGEGIPMETLQSAKYREVMSIRFYYDWHTDQLMEEAVRMMQTHLRAAPTVKKRAKTVYSQRNLGTIKSRKKEKKQETTSNDNAFETILKILRMRPHTSDFLGQQLRIMAQLRAEQEKRHNKLAR